MNQIRQGFLLTRHSRDHHNQTEIILWLATDDGPAKLVISGEQPLFFVAQKHQQAIEQTLSEHHIHHTFRPLELKTFDQEPVAALYFDSMHGFYNAKELLQSHHIEMLENDFRLQERFLMERFVRGGVEFVGRPRQLPKHTEYFDVKVRPCDYRPPLSVLSLDVECSMKGELYSIGFYGQIRNMMYQSVIMVGEYEEDAPEWIEWVKDEAALLHALENTFRATDPDIIIGWNVVNFDFKLLLERAALHNMKLHLGRAGAVTHWRDARGEVNQGFVTMPGRVVIDGIDALKSATYNFPSFSLENVSQTMLGRGKKTEDVDNRVETITEDFLHNKQKLAAYNLEDCALVWDIFEHTKVLDFLVLRSQLTGLELDRMGGSVAAFTNLYLPKLHRAGYIAPNLPRDGGLASPGGYVMNSRPGLYNHVLVLDFKSLYPSIIRTFKIDPMGLVEGLLSPDDAIPGFKEAFFSRDKHFLPQIITELWQQRDEAKRLKDAARSQAIKILMNSFYGVLGSGGCRFYDTRLASSITLRGHEIMQQTAVWIEEHGLQVIYGDTDSTFVWLKGDYTDEQADDIGKTLSTDINQRWHDRLKADFDLECQLELEYETHFSRFLMPTIRGSEVGSKKRYAGLIKGKDGADDKVIFKGLETVRTDWTELAKIFQTELFECVFHDKDPSNFVRDIVNQTRSGERDEQLVYRKRLRRKLGDYVKNVPPHVRAARIADEHNKREGKPLQYQHKGWISYVMTVAGPEPLEHQQSPLDYEHYIEKQLQPVADAILPFVSLSFEELVNAQMGLF